MARVSLLNIEKERKKYICNNSQRKKPININSYKPHDSALPCIFFATRRRRYYSSLAKEEGLQEIYFLKDDDGSIEQQQNTAAETPLYDMKPPARHSMRFLGGVWK